MERGIASERDRRPARCGWALSIGVHASIVGVFVFAAAPPQTRVPEPVLRVELLSAVPSRAERAPRRAAPQLGARPDATPAPLRGRGAAPAPAPVKAASRATEPTVAPIPKRKPPTPTPALAATPERLLRREPAPELPPSSPPSPISVAAPTSTPVGVPAGNPAPRYPREARRRGIEGRVVVRVTVDAEGAASRAWVHRSSGRPTLDRAVLSAVSEWRFLPARVGGRSVAGIVDVPVSFRLTP